MSVVSCYLSVAVVSSSPLIVPSSLTMIRKLVVRFVDANSQLSFYLRRSVLLDHDMEVCNIAVENGH